MEATLTFGRQGLGTRGGVGRKGKGVRSETESNASERSWQGHSPFVGVGGSANRSTRSDER